MKRTVTVVAMLCPGRARCAGVRPDLTAAQQANLEASLAVDTSVLKSADGQQLLRRPRTPATVPMRPANPERSPDDESACTGTTWSGRAGT